MLSRVATGFILFSLLLVVSPPTLARTVPSTTSAFPLSAASGGSSVYLPFIGSSPLPFQPVPPIRAAFFYPWFPEAWKQQGIFPYTNFHPSLGWYSSVDNAIIDQQLTLAAQAHLDAFISSWWGQGSLSDQHFQYALNRSARAGSPNPNLRWSVYYEAEAQGDPTGDQIAGDLQYLAGTAFSQPAYLRVNGNPVIFVYSAGNDACGMADRWAQAKSRFGGSVYVVLKVFVGYPTCANQPDSWHQYSPAVDYNQQAKFSAVVSPGFWQVGASPRLVRDTTRFESDVQKMVDSGAFWQLITTWNEWGEGTAVEPAEEWGNVYIDILTRTLP